MGRLIIRHIASEDRARFQVVRHRDGKLAEPSVEVAGPHSWPVDGRPNDDLAGQIRWYLESFLDYPFSPETEHAERVIESLRKWGRSAFDALFNPPAAREFLVEALDNRQYDKLHLQIESDDPRVLAWPWEALEDSRAARLAHLCRIERRVNAVMDPPPLSPNLPKDRVNILLVTARPYERDVKYRSVSRPLVELIVKASLPARVTVLRPPTFAQLRKHLHDNPNTYHIIHFDGHGGYGAAGPAHMLRGTSGLLVFEDETGKPDEVGAEKLSTLLREHAVPAVVLNACQSAMIDGRADDPFASVSVALVKAGVRSVVAMAYALYVSGAQEFLPAFYERLFESGDVAEGLRAGRQRMYEQPNRICSRGRYPLGDWLLPVAYQQDPLDFSFATAGAPTEQTARLPEEADDSKNPYGFVGRDRAVLELERALRRKPAAIVIHGLGGVGKTTLARGFVKWLAETDGLGDGCLWLGFQDVRSAEYVVNRMGEPLFGANFSAADMETKLKALTKELTKRRLLIVWDNFESARGIPGTHVSGNLPPEDQQVLLRLIQGLRHGASKILVTSRATEAWLGGPEYRYMLELGGLDGEERWEYCEAIVHDLGLLVNREDEDLLMLMDLLRGHPLAMRVALPMLATKSAAHIGAVVSENLTLKDFPQGLADEHLAAILRFLEDGLPESQRELLIPLSMFEDYTLTFVLEAMCNEAGVPRSRAEMDLFLTTLGTAGLCREAGEGVWELHPSLTGYLRASARKVVTEPWECLYARAMAGLSQQIVRLKPHEKRRHLAHIGPSIASALSVAVQHKMFREAATISEVLAHNALDLYDQPRSHQLFTQMAELSTLCGQSIGTAAAYHQLGIIELRNRNFDEANQWFDKSEQISEQTSNQSAIAATLHQRGMLAQIQRQFEAALGFFHRSIDLSRALGNEAAVANTYHQMGRLFQEILDYSSAEDCFLKSLEYFTKVHDEHGSAQEWHQLGTVAEARGELDQAESWYMMAVEYNVRHGYRREASINYHQLGTVSLLRRDLDEAERRYQAALELKERLGDLCSAASTYHQLGMVAANRGDYVVAQTWYEKSLAANERCANKHGIATTWGAIAGIALNCQDTELCAHCLARSISLFARTGDDNMVAVATGHFAQLVADSTPDIASRLRNVWSQHHLDDTALNPMITAILRERAK